MATEDDKPQTTFATGRHLFLQEREKEEREFLTEVSGIPVTKLPLPEMKQVEPLHDDIEGSCELKNGELNTEPESSNQNKDEYGGVLQEESSLYSIEATSAHSAEVKDVGEGVHFEDGSTKNKFNTTTVSSEGDPHATSITAKEAKSSEISSTPEATELDPEILHSSVSVMDEIIEKEDSSDLSQSTSTQTTCQNDHIEETKGSSQIAEIQPASHVITLNMTDASAETAGSATKNYEVKSPDDATDDSNEDVGISSHSEYPNKEDDWKEKENGDSNKEQLSSPLFAESTEETISKNMDSDKVEQLEGNSGTKYEDNQGTSKLSLDMTEIEENELDILGTDRLESSISETQDSSCDKNESIREVSDVASMSKESQPKEREVSDIVLMSAKENQPKEILEDDSEQMMQQKEEVSSEEHNFTSQGSHDMENRSEEDLQVKNIISMCPKEEANSTNDQEIRGTTSENVATDLEEDQSNRRIPESAEENSSLQEFQMIAKANKVVAEANYPELLPMKDLRTVTSDEVPEAVITEAAKGVIWEQKEILITKESEELKKRNDKLADATNLLSQSSEENSNNYQAIEGADDCTDNTNISRMPNEEKTLEEVHVDDKSLAASDIDSREKPLENNNRSNTGLSSEEVSDVKLGNVLDLALQPQTTESEHANKDSIGIGSSNLTENEAAGKASTDILYRSQDQGVEKIVESGDTHTVKCDAENKKKEDSCKGTAVPESESSDTVIESNVGLDQTSSAAKIVDILEVIPPVMLPKGKDHETWNILENKKDGSTSTNEDIVNETSDASFATNFNEAFFQKEENEAPESDFRDSPFKVITEEHNGIEASEAEGKEHIAEVDNPAIVKCENRMELPVEKKTDDEKSLKSDDTSKDDERLDISQSLGIGTQPNKDDQQEEATELFTRPEEVAQSKVDTGKFQEFIKANDTEINQEKLEGATIGKGETILTEKSNEIQEILSNDHSVEKIGNKHRSTKDSSCYSPREEINQKSNHEDDLKLEVDPEVKADGTFVATNKTSSSTKFEEPEITDAAESFKKEMATEEKFVEGPSQVSAEDETAKHTAEEGTEKRNVNDTTTYHEFKQEVDPEVKADETKNNASQSTKTEEHETIYSTQSIQKQIPDKEQVAEGPHQTAEEIPNDQPPEEKKERNFIDIKKKDDLKPEPHTGLSADEISGTINDTSNSTKFEEAETIEATQSFNNHLPSNDKVGEGSWQIAEQLENYIPTEEGKEETNVKDKTAADELKPEIHTGEKFEEPEAVEAIQGLNTPMPSGDQVVEVPFQASIAEDVVNYSTAEEGKEERNAIDTTEDDLKPEVDPEVKVDEISATASNTSRSTKQFEGTEIFDTTQSFRKQSPTKNKDVEGPSQVSTAEEIVNYCPAEEAKEERNVKDTTILEKLNPELAPAIKPDEISETINNESFQEPEPNDASQSVNRQIPSEDKVVEQPDQVSTGEEIVKYHFAEEDEENNVKNIITAYELQPNVDPGGSAGEISDRTHFAIESTKFEDPKTVDATQSFNKQTTREDKVVEGPPQVSTADEAVNYGSVEEEREQGNVEDATLSYELNPDADRGEKINKVSESTENASESIKFEEPQCVDVSENFKKDIPSEDKVVKGHPRVSTEEEIVNFSSATEGNAESNVKETTTRDELKPEVDPKVELEVPEIVEATHGITTHMPSEDEVVEGTPKVSIAEEVGNYRLAKERKEDRKVNNAIGEELPTRTKLEETNGTDVTQSFEKEIPEKGNVVEEFCQVSAAEEPVNDNSTEGEQRNIIDAAIQDELKPEAASGIKLDETSEHMKNASESTKPIAANQSVNKQIKNAKDTIPLEEYHELNSKTESGMMTDEISETHYARESTKSKEPEAVDATASFQEEKPKEGKIFEGHPKVSTAEEIVNYSPAEEQKDERNVKDTIISNELNPEVDPGEISPTIDSASQITKFKGPEVTGVTPSSNKEMPSEVMVVEGPSQVSTPEGIASYIPEEEEEGKAERNIKETSTRDELKMEADPKIEEDEISETKNSSTETTEFELPEIIEATTEVNIQIPCEDKIAEESTHVLISQHVESCSLEEERKDKNVNDVTGYESPTRIKLDGSHMTDATQSFEKEIPKQPFLFSAAEELVNDSPTEEGKKEQNVIDAATQDKLQPEVAPGIKLDEISMTMKNFQEPQPIDATQPIEGPRHVSTEEEIVSYHLPDEEEEKNVKDTITDEISETHYASESTQFKEAKTVDATSSFQKQMSKEGKVVKGHSIVSTAEKIVNCSPAEEEEERNAKDTTISDDLKPEVDSGAKLNELSETVDNASGSAKIKEPERIEVTQSFSNEVPMDDKVVEGPPLVSTVEEIVNYCRAEDTKTEINVNETSTREPNTGVNPEVEIDEVSKTTKSASETIKFEVPGTTEATQEINIQMPSEEKVIEEPFKVSIAENVGNYGREEERKEDKNVQNTTARETAKLEVPEIVEGTHGINTHMPSEDKVVEGTPEDSITEDVGNSSPAEERKEHRTVNNAAGDELPTRTKLEETNGTDVTQGFEKEISQKGNVVEEPCQVSATEEPVNDNSTEEGEERNIIDAATQDELKPEVAPGIKLDEISENMENASESTKFYEPESIDATQRVNKQIKSEEKLVEGSHHELTADEIVNYYLEGKGEVKCVKDTIPVEEYHELKPKTESGLMAYEIYETHYASESTKFKEPEAVAATTSFQEEMPKEGKIVEGCPKFSTEEEIVNYSPAEEEKDERTVEDTTISNELNPEVDEGEISPIIDNASQITKCEGPEITGATPSFNKEMPSEDKAAEGPSQISTPEGTVSYIPEEEQEGKAERNVKEMSTRDDLEMEADLKIEEDEISETKNNSTETTEFELAENIEANMEVNIHMPSEDKIAEGSVHVSIAEHAGSCSLEEERKDKNVNGATGYELPTRTKLEGSHMTDATQSFEEIPKQPFLVSSAEKLVSDSPAEEGKGERNVTDAASQEELQPEVAPGIKLDEISTTMKNFRQPEPIDATQSVKEQITSEDKVVEGSHHVAIEEEIVSYHLADEGHEKNIRDTITMGELKLKAQSEGRTDEISETHYASESTQFKEAETVDATSSFRKQMSKEDQVAQGPPTVSTAEQIVNCSPAEEEEERNAKDTINDDLKPEVDPGAKLNKLSETIDNASESTKIKEPERIDVTQSFNNEVPIKNKVAELPLQFSTAEEIVNYSCTEEGKAEKSDNETATRELNMEVNPKVEIDEVSKTTKSASETSKFEVPDTIEATQGINIQMPSEEKAIEEPFEVSIAEDVGNYRREEERKEDINVQNTTADKLPTQIKLEESDAADVTQCFKKQIASKDQVVEGPFQVSTAEELVNFSPAEEEKEESSVMDVSIQDKVKPEVAPEITPDETLETMKNASESTEIQEPETTDANQSSNKQMTYEDRDIEGPYQVSIAEGIDHYSLAQGEEWNVNDTRILNESKPDANPEARADPISETTYYASRSTKFEEPATVDASQSFNKQMSGENKVVEGPPQVSTAEEMVDYSAAEERKEEPNIKDTTTSDDLKPEVDPGLKPNNTSNLINNASQNPKLEDDEIVHVTQKCNKQMPSEDEVVEGHPQVPTAEGIQNFHPTEEGTDESSGKVTSAKDDVKTEVYPIVKFEESETLDATQSSKKKISSEDNVVGGSCEVSTAKEITHYSIEEEGEETNMKDTTTANELKTEENTREKFDETETTDATQSFDKQTPSDVEGFRQCSTAVDIVNYSPTEEEKEERNVKDATTKLELQEQAAKSPGRNTETEVTTSDEKVEIPEVGFPKYDEGVTGCNERQNTYRNYLGENIVSEAETLNPVDEKLEDYPKSEDVAEDDTNALESHKDAGQSQYSPSKSLYEITNDPEGLNLEKQEGSVDKAVILLHSGTSGDEESNKLDKEEQYLLITEKESKEDVSSTAQGSKFKDEEKEEKVEEQENHSTRTNVTKLDGDEISSKKIENEEKKFHNQNQNSDLPITEQESAREIQVEIKELHPGKDSIVVTSEVGGESGGERKTIDECEGTSSSIQSDLIPEMKARERPTEEILAKAECREDKDQVDTIKEIAQKDELAALTQATNNSQDIDMPCKSSIAMSDLEILANEDPETGSERQILSDKKDISQVHEGLRGEILQPETEELKPGDTSQAVAEAVRAEYGEKEQFNDDCNKQTENFRPSKLEENSPSKLEQSSQETPQEQEDGEVQDQQNNINDSRVEIARNERPLDASSQMDTNLPLDMQKLDVAPCCEFDKQVVEADPNDSAGDTKDLPEVQQKTIAESFCAGGENQEPVKCNEDKENEEAMGKSILEEKSTTSLPEPLKVPRNEISQDSGDFNSESKKTIQREEMKDGKTRTCEPEDQNTNDNKDEEGEGNQQKRTESGYDHPVAVEASKDINVKASTKKSHNILSGVGSKVKHSISKVKKAITGKSSHPKPSSPK